MNAAVERGWRGLGIIEQEGLLEPFIELIAQEPVRAEAFERLRELMGYGISEDGLLFVSEASLLPHAAATIAFAEQTEPFVFKLPFFGGQGVALRLVSAPFFELLRIEAGWPVDEEIMREFHAVLPVINGAYCMSEMQIYALFEHYLRTGDVALALHDFSFKAHAAGLSFHYDERFFARYPLDEKHNIHRLLYLLAREQRMAAAEFEMIYGVLPSTTPP